MSILCSKRIHIEVIFRNLMLLRLKHSEGATMGLKNLETIDRGMEYLATISSYIVIFNYLVQK